MIFLTTAEQDVDEELLHRCMVLTVNEEQEQTRAIHRKQHEAQTIERRGEPKFVLLICIAERLTVLSWILSTTSVPWWGYT
jgi:hypothetical protein